MSDGMVIARPERDENMRNTFATVFVAISHLFQRVKFSVSQVPTPEFVWEHQRDIIRHGSYIIGLLHQIGQLISETMWQLSILYYSLCR